MRVSVGCAPRFTGWLVARRAALHALCICCSPCSRPSMLRFGSSMFPLRPTSPTPRRGAITRCWWDLVLGLFARASRHAALWSLRQLLGARLGAVRAVGRAQGAGPFPSAFGGAPTPRCRPGCDPFGLCPCSRFRTGARGRLIAPRAYPGSQLARGTFTLPFLPGGPQSSTCLFLPPLGSEGSQVGGHPIVHKPWRVRFV